MAGCRSPSRSSACTLSAGEVSCMPARCAVMRARVASPLRSSTRISIAVPHQPSTANGSASRGDREPQASSASPAAIAISFGVFLMVAVGLILMFTLPFSKGQYFNFNPEPFAAIFAAIVVMPFVMSLCLFSISSSTKIPFIFTSIVATIIAIQATATIISNSYFMGIFPFYILNILPAIVLDIILLKYRNHKNNNGNGNNAASAAIIHTDKRYLVASMLVSLFFITLFFPWTVDVFGGFFKPSNEVRTEQFLLQILFPVILPIVIPIALLSSFMGGYVVQRLHKKSQQN